MDRLELAAALTELTESLSPGPGVTENELRSARSALAEALVSGKSLAELRPGFPRTSGAELTANQKSAIDEIAGATIAQTASSPRRESRFAVMRTRDIRSDF